MQSYRMTRVVDGVRYDTAKAEVIAHDCYWDGHNFERSGTNTYLFRAPRSCRYFVQHLTMWQGSRSHLEPVDQAEARRLYEEDLPEHELEYEEAFPGVEVVDA